MRDRGVLAPALLTVVVVLAVLAAPAGPVAPAGAEPAARGDAYDTALGERDCDLLGRDYAPGRGCSRTRCQDGAVPFRKVYGAEACALRGQPKGYGFVATVDVRQCRALGRRWLEEVNYCASEPDRGITALYGATQCAGGATVYVPLREEEGYYDECLTFARASELTALAAEEGTTLQAQVELRSGVQCAHRPRHRFVDGRCVEDPTVVPSGAGVLVVGDSLTWRGGDELTRLQPRFAIDGEPARPATQLSARLAAYRALHGDPTGVVVELGTVPAPGLDRRDFTRALAGLPRGTEVMLVLPHFEVRSDPVVVSPQSREVGAWMASIARERRGTCLADWPAYVRSHRGVLQDGVHVKRSAEGRWARWLVREWKRC